MCGCSSVVIRFDTIALEILRESLHLNVTLSRATQVTFNLSLDGTKTYKRDFMWFYSEKHFERDDSCDFSDLIYVL